VKMNVIDLIVQYVLCKRTVSANSTALTLDVQMKRDLQIILIKQNLTY